MNCKKCGRPLFIRRDSNEWYHYCLDCGKVVRTPRNASKPPQAVKGG